MDDLISRKAAIDALMPIYKSASLRNRNVFSTARKCMSAIEDLPSAQPEKRTQECTETHACDLISRQALCDYALNQKDKSVTPNDIMRFPPAQLEQKVEELLPDGTLHLFTDTDLSKVNRVWVSQNGTHYGDLYYADEDLNCGADMRGEQDG